MKASELRIGNFVFGVEQGYKETALPIACLHNDDTVRLQVGNDTVGCYRSKAINPIPLTEEWLLMFGFKKVGEAFYIGLEYEYFLNGIFNDYTAGCTISLNIKYVHQLQNLYFALTGEEITTTE